MGTFQMGNGKIDAGQGSLDHALAIFSRFVPPAPWDWRTRPSKRKLVFIIAVLEIKTTSTGADRMALAQITKPYAAAGKIECLPFYRSAQCG
jgi:hypothetical protein